MAERETGTLVRWLPNSGFGFIAPDQGGKDMFVAVREFNRMRIDPRENMRLSYEIEPDREGRPRATALKVAADTEFEDEDDDDLAGMPFMRQRVG